jgi:hypothetical protein
MASPPPPPPPPPPPAATTGAENLLIHVIRLISGPTEDTALERMDMIVRAWLSKGPSSRRVFIRNAMGVQEDHGDDEDITRAIRLRSSTEPAMDAVNPFKKEE